MTSASALLTVLLSVQGVACGGPKDDDTEADRLGVAASCKETAECPEVEIAGEMVQLDCLTQFDAGYCAIRGCDSALDCPGGATCVAHEGTNYCFRECVDKSECNVNREPDHEANCSSNFDYADSADDVSGVKACIPPSSGD